MNNTEKEEQIFKTIINGVKAMISNLKFNRTLYGVIKANKSNGLYSVDINGAESDIYALDGKVFNVNDVVIVEVCNNNFNTDKFILGKRPY